MDEQKLPSKRSKIMINLKIKNAWLFFGLIKVVFVTLALSFIGFQKQTSLPNISPKELSKIEGNRWESDKINGQKILIKSPSDGMGKTGKPYLDLSENLFKGFTGCNQISGRFIENGNNIKFTLEKITANGCNDSLMKQERDFTELLKQTTHYDLSEKTLNLYAENRLLLRFSKVEKHPISKKFI